MGGMYTVRIPSIFYIYIYIYTYICLLFTGIRKLRLGSYHRFEM